MICVSKSQRNGYKFNWNQNQGSACNSGVERIEWGLPIIRINNIIYRQMYFQIYPEQQYHMQKSNSRSLQKYKLRIEHLPYLDDSLLYSFHSTESLRHYLLSLSKPVLLWQSQYLSINTQSHIILFASQLKRVPIYPSFHLNPIYRSKDTIQTVIQHLHKHLTH